MRQTSGGVWLVQLMILFILLFAGYIILTIEYSKNVRVKNEMISIIERYDGLNKQSVTLLNNYLSSTGYNVRGKCESGDGIYGALELQDTELEETTGDNDYYYCVKKYKGANTSYYYQVTVFYRFNLPVLGDVSRFTIKGTTSNFQSQDESKYCMTISGPCRGSSGNNNQPTETITYIVNFDLNGGVGNISSQSVKQGKRVDEPSDPTRDGYVFRGWTLNGSNYDFYTPVYSSMTLVAKWESTVSDSEAQNTPKKYTIVFDFNGGKWGAGNQFSGWSSLTDYEVSGYNKRFDGMWESTTKSGYTLDYFVDQDGKKYYRSNASFIVTKDMKLQAVWK